MNTIATLIKQRLAQARTNPRALHDVSWALGQLREVVQPRRSRRLRESDLDMATKGRVETIQELQQLAKMAADDYRPETLAELTAALTPFLDGELNEVLDAKLDQERKDDDMQMLDDDLTLNDADEEDLEEADEDDDVDELDFSEDDATDEDDDEEELTAESDDEHSCPACGAELLEDQRFCSACGNQLRESRRTFRERTVRPSAGEIFQESMTPTGRFDRGKSAVQVFDEVFDPLPLPRRSEKSTRAARIFTEANRPWYARRARPDQSAADVFEQAMNE